MIPPNLSLRGLTTSTIQLPAEQWSGGNLVGEVRSANRVGRHIGGKTVTYNPDLLDHYLQRSSTFQPVPCLPRAGLTVASRPDRYGGEQLVGRPNIGNQRGSPPGLLSDSMYQTAAPLAPRHNPQHAAFNFPRSK